jgi:hypothetical protein
MTPRPITCELVDELDLDTRYLAGGLGEEDAAAFEAHYLGCDRCWALVRGGVAVRVGEASATVPRPAATAPPQLSLPARRPPGLRPVAFGVWRFSTGGAPEAANALRGAEADLLVSAELTATDWRVTWPRVVGAGRYRIRIFTEDGALRLERETGDTVIAGPAADLGGPGPFLADVEAFDAVLGTVARSALTRVHGPGPR